MEQPQISINFRRGDIVHARGQIGVIVDVLESAETDNVCLYVRFVHNLGNARAYDVLELSPEKMLGVDQWRQASREDLETAIAKRRGSLDREIGDLLSIALADNSH